MCGLRRALLLTALIPGWALAANKTPDADLLEFLGSLDAEGSGWSEYLEGTNLDRSPTPGKRGRPGPNPPPRVVQPAKPATPPTASQTEPAK